MGVRIMERKYISKNGVVESTRFAVGANTRRLTGKRTGRKCSVQKQTENDKLAVRTLARVLNCNFGVKDLLVTLKWSDPALEKIRRKVRQSGITEDSEGWMDAVRKAADHECQLWQRRISRKLPKDVQLKMVAVTSDVDGESGEAKRVHSHIVMSGGIVSWDEIQRQWKNGSVDIRALSDQDDYTPVAVYMLKQVRRVPEQNRYRTTRNMEKPRIEEREITGTAPIRLPAGAKLLERQYDAEVIGQYVRYKRKKTEQNRENLARVGSDRFSKGGGR